MKNKIYGILTFVLALFTILLFVFFTDASSDIVFEGFKNQSIEFVKINNLVTSIYLDFRLFDTIFEALLLLVSIGAIFTFSSLSDHEKNISHPKFDHEDKNIYSLPRIIMSIIYPLLILFGIYMIVNGADSPGGGFQAGAILASIFMSRYIAEKNYNYDYKRPYNFEKLTFIVFLILAILFLLNLIPRQYLRTYILAMNILIAIKVMFGFAAIFIKFINGDSDE